MSSQYNENNFSTESTSASVALNNTNKTARPNIDHLIRRILTERRRERRNAIILGFVILTAILTFIYFQN
tara:strand:+ start:216 stop:425 length:210 start_codon:yes stop_codon:yes gene_type:complete